MKSTAHVTVRKVTPGFKTDTRQLKRNMVGVGEQHIGHGTRKDDIH